MPGRPDELRIGLLGCGTVGGAVVRLLRTNGEEIRRRTGMSLRITRVAVAHPEKSRGLVFDRGVLGVDAAAVVADPHIFAAGRSLQEAVTQLRTLPGIGEWTAQYIAMRQLREPDAFPAADIGLMRAMAGPEGLRPSASELLARAEQWRPWRAYAAQHLWASA